MERDSEDWRQDMWRRFEKNLLEWAPRGSFLKCPSEWWPQGRFFPLYIVFLLSRHWPGKSQDLNCGYQSSSIIRAQGHWTHKTNGYKTGTKSFFPLKVLHGCCHANVMEKNDGSSCNSASYRSNLVTLGQLNWSHYVSRKFSLWNFSFFFIWLEL